MNGNTATHTEVESETAVLQYLEALLVEPAPVEKTAGAFAAPSPSASQAQSNEAAQFDRSESEAVPGAGHADRQISGSGVDADTESESVDIKSNPFLMQLEAAQRRGSSTVPSEQGSAAALAQARRVDNRPRWGRQDFSCISFKVSGLKLAVPVEFIEGMHPLDLLPARADNHSNVADVNCDDQGVASLLLGQMLLHRPDEQPTPVDVIDTARIVMPERYDSGMQESYRYVLGIKNANWCIAVDAIGGELALSSSKVRWRSEHTRREWLAGTVVDKMCALIDIDVLNRQVLAERVLQDNDEENSE